MTVKEPLKSAVVRTIQYVVLALSSVDVVQVLSALAVRLAGLVSVATTVPGAPALSALIVTTGEGVPETVLMATVTDESANGAEAAVVKRCAGRLDEAKLAVTLAARGRLRASKTFSAPTRYQAPVVKPAGMGLPGVSVIAVPLDFRSRRRAPEPEMLETVTS